MSERKTVIIIFTLGRSIDRYNLIIRSEEAKVIIHQIRQMNIELNLNQALIQERYIFFVWSVRFIILFTYFKYYYRQMLYILYFVSCSCDVMRSKQWKKILHRMSTKQKYIYTYKNRLFHFWFSIFVCVCFVFICLSIVNVFFSAQYFMLIKVFPCFSHSWIERYEEKEENIPVENFQGIRILNIRGWNNRKWYIVDLLLGKNSFFLGEMSSFNHHSPLRWIHYPTFPPPSLYI